MSTGRKTLKENTRERVVSSDINRLQTFGQADANDLLAAQVLQPTDDTAYVGTTFPSGTTPPLSFAIFQDKVTAPSYGAILEGLMVIVPAAATSILVTPGVALVIDPDGQPGSTTPTPPSPDDSVSKMIRGLGVPLGALPWTPNGGGGIRVDVVEIQRADVVTETDNRDIFNPATGLFTAQAVTKVTDGQVSYRIRLGIPGGGLPAPALGWLPIAVMATPVGAPDLNTVNVWDVRNLAADYETPGAVRLTGTVRTERQQWLIDESVALTLRLSGFCVKDLLGFRFGGSLFDIDTGGTIDLLLPKFQEAGFAPAAGLPYYVYSAFPAGYARWVRYYQTPTATVGGRVPGFLRGFILVSQTPPLNDIATAPIAMPAFWGIGGSAVVAVALASSVTDTAAKLKGAVNDGEMTHVNYASGGVPWQTLLPAIAFLSAVWPLVPGVNYPAGTKRIRVGFGFLFGAIGAPGSSALISFIASLYNAITTNFFVQLDELSMVLINPAVGGPFVVFTVDIPVGNDGFSSPANPPTMRVQGVALAASVPPPPAFGAGQAVVIGWE